MKTVNLLIKPASSLCNLRCRYCFYEAEARNRVHPSMGMLSDELAEALIRQAFEAADPAGAVSFAFQGGEPTVAGLPFFQRFVQLAKERKPPAVRMHFSIQTNGTLLNGDWADFFRRERFLVGLSLDGFRDAHDAHRVDARGEGTWKAVVAAKKLLDQYRVETNALCVVTARCAENPEKAYRNLKNLGFRYIQFIACLDPLDEVRGQEPWSLTPEAYGRFLCRVFDLWYQDWLAGNYHSVRLFDDYIHLLLGDGASTCAACGKCGAYFVVEGDGSVYPCDFYALDAWRMGTIRDNTLSQLAGSESAKRFLAWGQDKPAQCRSCPYGSLCNGGCKNDWFADSDGSHNYYCASFQTLLDYALPRMRRIAQAERLARGRGIQGL